MGHHYLLRVISFLALATRTTGYSGGAPTDIHTGICETLAPSHGALKQTSSPPYSVSVSSNSFTPGGADVTVTISSNSGTVFKGFLLTAEQGTFTPSGNDSKLACTGGRALTHTSNSSKTSLSFQWTPPANSTGHVQLRATFVQDKGTFWVDIPNVPQLQDSTPGATARPAATGTVTKDSECGKTKGCYSKCSGTNCDYIAIWEPQPTFVHITLSGVVGADNRYIALGLSDDKDMGSDSVTFCVAGEAKNSYNDGKSNKNLANPIEGLSNIESTYNNGVLSCSFDRLIAADGSGQRYTLDQPYYLFFAIGPKSGAGIDIHAEIPAVPQKTASLLDVTFDLSGTEDTEVLVKTHGSLMIVAWVLAASIGIVIARYGKNVWETSTLFGQKVWFQIHRTCMVLAFLATAVAFIIIFVDVGGYSEIYGEGYKKAHPILGIIVMALTLLNPIMAACRPHPTEKNRPIFNWAHWFVGIAAYTLGLITIFFGITLEKSGAPEYMLYILAAFVGWMFLIQVILEVMQHYSQRSALMEVTPIITASSHPDLNREGSSERYEMNDMADNDTGKSPAPKQSGGSKLLLLILHMLVVFGFSVALIIVLNIGEDDDDHDHDH